MSYCDIALIIRGYRWRNVLSLQLQRLQWFASATAFSGNPDHKKPEDLMPLYFDRYKACTKPALTEEEVNEELRIINAANEHLKAGGKF